MHCYTGSCWSRAAAAVVVVVYASSHVSRGCVVCTYLNPCSATASGNYRFRPFNGGQNIFKLWMSDKC